MRTRTPLVVALVMLLGAGPAAARSPEAHRIGARAVDDLRSIDRHLTGFRYGTRILARACEAADGLSGRHRAAAKDGIAEVAKPLRARIVNYRDRFAPVRDEANELTAVQGLDPGDQTLVDDLHQAIRRSLTGYNEARQALVYSLDAARDLHCNGHYSARSYLKVHERHADTADARRRDAADMVKLL